MIDLNTNGHVMPHLYHGADLRRGFIFSFG
jgi:hypothetical protein